NRQTAELRILPDLLHRLIAVHLRHHDVHQDNGDVRIGFDVLDGLVASRRTQNLHAAPLEHAAQREDVAGIVVDQQNGAVDEILVGAVEPLEHALLFRRKVCYDAVEEERRLIEQTLGRFDAFHHDAARHRMEPGVLFGAELPPGEYYDRHVG